MYKAIPTIPVSKLRTKQAAILTQLEQTPIRLTQRGHSVGILVHPALWREMVERLTRYEDILIAQDRLQEAEQNPALLCPISELRTLLQADGLLVSDPEQEPVIG